MHEGQADISLNVLRNAIEVQVPEFRHLQLRRLASAGTVVAPFRLGEDYLVRVPLVPRADDAARRAMLAQGMHAAFLRGRLPVEVPALVKIGEPVGGYPGVWSIWTWTHGESLDVADGVSLPVLARDLAVLLRSVHALPTDGRSWNGVGRGARPLADTAWVRTSIERSAHLVDPVMATAVWERALGAPAYAGPAAYIHGDPMPGNLVVSHGRLTGLIDISEPSFGDPASDLAPAWTVFEEPARSVFREQMGLDDAAWERGRGWAFEMAIGGLHYYEHTNPAFAALAARTLQRLIDTMPR